MATACTCMHPPERCLVTTLFRDLPRQIQKLVLANIDTAGTRNRSPCNTVHRSLVAHGIGAHGTHFWSLGPGVRRASVCKDIMCSNKLQKRKHAGTTFNQLTWHLHISAAKLSNHHALPRLPKTNAEACSGK